MLNNKLLCTPKAFRDSKSGVDPGISGEGSYNNMHNICKYIILANSHALCMTLMPID